MRRLALALALLGCPAGAQTDADPAAIACHAFTPEADYADTTVVRQLEGGEVTLRVPRQYFEDFWDRAGGYRDTAQLFRVEIGSFEPVSRHETGERNKQGIWNWMPFLVGDVISLEEIGRWHATGTLFSWEPGPAFADLAHRPFGFDLTHVESPEHEDDGWPAWDTDLYIDRNLDGGVRTLLICDTLGRANYPGCEQRFRAAGLDVQLSYRRT
jgi:hypothetical protein